MYGIITSSIGLKYTNFDQKIEIANNNSLGVRIRSATGPWQHQNYHPLSFGCEY